MKEILTNEEINLSKSNCDSGCKVRKLSSIVPKCKFSGNLVFETQLRSGAH